MSSVFLVLGSPLARALLADAFARVATGRGRTARFANESLEIACDLEAGDDTFETTERSFVLQLGAAVSSPGSSAPREGRFVRIEVDAAGNAMIETDALGMYPLYVGELECEHGPITVVTSHLSIVRRGDERANDPVGIASFLALGWPLAHRTLDRRFRVLSAGITRFAAGRHGAQAGGLDIVRSLLPARRERESTRELAKRTLDELSALARARYATRPDTVVQLTGGQDSRLVLAICVAAGFRPECVTRGDANDPEVRIARAVAREVGSSHRVLAEGDCTLDWRERARELLARTDGMVSLWQLADVRARGDGGPRDLSMLGGIGGETARRYYRQESTLDARATGAEIVSRLHRRLAKNPGDLIATPVFLAFESALRERLLELVEPLVDPRDLPDVFYAFERVRRWGGNNARKIDPAATTLPLLATATFTRAALALDPNARIESALHREMVFAANRSLAEVPLLGSDWSSDWKRGRSMLGSWIARWRHRGLARVAAAGTATTIESGRDRLMASLVRELAPRILDSPSSWFFEIVDRGAFERALGRGDSRSRDAASQALVAALTVWLAVEGSSP